MFRKDTVPAEVKAAFDDFVDSGFMLTGRAPLMPTYKPRGYFGTLRALKKIKILPAGTFLEFVDVKVRGPIAWYKVQVKGSLVSGWINGLIFSGGIN